MGSGGEDLALHGDHLVRWPAGVTRQRRSARACSVPSPEQGGSTSTRSNAAAGLARRARSARRRRPRRSRWWRATAGRCARGCRRGVCCARRRATSPLALHERGEVGALAAGGGAQVEHALTRARDRACARRAWRPVTGREARRPATAREPCTSNGSSSTSASGIWGSRWVRTGSRGGERRRRR